MVEGKGRQAGLGKGIRTKLRAQKQAGDQSSSLLGKKGNQILGMVGTVMGGWADQSLQPRELGLGQLRGRGSMGGRSSPLQMGWAVWCPDSWRTENWSLAVVDLL